MRDSAALPFAVRSELLSNQFALSGNRNAVDRTPFTVTFPSEASLYT